VVIHPVPKTGPLVLGESPSGTNGDQQEGTKTPLLVSGEFHHLVLKGVIRFPPFQFYFIFGFVLFFVFKISFGSIKNQIWVQKFAKKFVDVVFFISNYENIIYY
jgi:hypothetical protein